MARAVLEVDLAAIRANWRALDARTSAETGAAVKADAYGLGLARVAPALAEAGCRTFFVAIAEEGAELRRVLGPGPAIYVFSGMMEGDAPVLDAAQLIPLLNTPRQIANLRKLSRAIPYGVQLDTGMNRLGLEPADLAALDGAPSAPVLAMSHLACSDTPSHDQNAVQRAAFEAMTAAPALSGVPRSLAATGGVLLGAPFAYDLTRPGIGLYGGAPFAEAAPVVRVTVPVIQIRDVAAGESVGYGASYLAEAPRRIATIAAGYADGLHRALGAGAAAYAPDGTGLPTAGRISMDLIGLDVTDAPDLAEGDAVELIGPNQRVDVLAGAAGTIGYEFLTSLGLRYARRYNG